VVGFAPADSPVIAVAVLVKAQPGVSEVTGGAVAAPIAREVIVKALAAHP
jgi:cell division protein FtsI/penicillin-binding protein 2